MVWALFKRLASGSGLLVCLFSVLCVFANDVYAALFESWKSAFPYIVYLLIGSIFGYRIKTWGLFLFLLLLPISPNLHNELMAFMGADLFQMHFSGLDLAAGFVLGSSVRYLPLGFSRTRSFYFPWQIGLLLTYLSFSTFLTIVRNLRQSASGTSIEGLLYNFIHFRPFAWHDDFMPLSDLIAYGISGAIIACLIPFLSEKQNRNQLIFKPIVWGLILAALMGCMQAMTGFGLPIEYLNFRKDSLGFVAIGFHPDIHAYAGYLLLGAVGLWAYVFNTQNQKEKTWIYLAIAMSWLALVLSKSRASLALAVIACIMLLLVHFWYQKRKYFSSAIFVIVTSIVAFAVSLNYLAQHPQVLSGNGWLSHLISQYANAGLSGLSSGTQDFGGRPEIYLAAMRMFAEFPIIGLGQGGFFRQSADIGFSKSFMLSHWGGENAHNYFLQVLVENGVVGFLLFGLVVVSPFLFVGSKKGLVPAALGLLALFLGNLFAHSFLVRENLILAAVLIALMYSWVYAKMQVDGGVCHLRKWCSGFRLVLIAGLVTFFVVLGSLEIYRSFFRFPYQIGQRCFVSKPLSQDGWSSGLFDIPLPAGAHGLKVYIASVGRPDLHRRPLQARMDIAYYEQYSHDHPPLATVFYEWKAPGPGVMELNLQDNRKLANGKGKAVLRLSNCFNPKDYGISQDGRNLGVLIDRIEVF